MHILGWIWGVVICWIPRCNYALCFAMWQGQASKRACNSKTHLIPDEGTCSQLPPQSPFASNLGHINLFFPPALDPGNGHTLSFEFLCGPAQNLSLLLTMKLLRPKPSTYPHKMRPYWIHHQSTPTKYVFSVESGIIILTVVIFVNLRWVSGLYYQL